jgi:uncharacterized membrane protein YraQ (UPF0718 family)
VTAVIREEGLYFLQLVAVIVPLFVVASFLVGVAREYLSPERVTRTLRDHDEGSGNVAAAGLGAVTPFCSCSSVPLVAGLLQAGAPLGIVFSFLLASPLINEIAVPLLAGLFGLRFAVLYVVVMFAAAVVVGVLLGRFDLEAHVEDVDGLDGFETRTAIQDGGTVEGAAVATPGVTAASHRARLRRAGRQAWQFLREMLPYVFAGVAVATLVHGVVPVAWLRAVLGPGNPLAVPFAVLAGVPLYFSLSAMLPVAAALVSKGVPIGTVLALLVGTVGVSLPNLVLLRKLFSPRLLTAYVLAVTAIGVAVGLLFNALPV